MKKQYIKQLIIDRINNSTITAQDKDELILELIKINTKQETQQYLDIMKKFVNKLTDTYKLEIPEFNQYYQIKTITQTIHTQNQRESRNIPDLVVNSIIDDAKYNTVNTIDYDYDYEEIKLLSRLIYDRTGNLSFFVSNSFRMKGSVVSELGKSAEEYPVITLVESRTTNENNIPTRAIRFIDEYYDKRKWDVIQELTCPFFLYRFLGEDNKEYVLFSKERLVHEEYTLNGMLVGISDRKEIGEVSRVAKKLEIVFVHNVKKRIIVFKNHDELINFVEKKRVNRNFLTWLFSKTDGDKRYLYEHPKWFMDFIGAWVLHAKWGRGVSYPIHLIIVAKEGTGKTTLLECLSEKFAENEPVIGAGGCTLKYFIPSYARNPPQIGALAKANRVCLVDEYFRALITNTREGAREEGMARMNDLLEHRKRAMGSGASGQLGDVVMRARLLSVTNPIYGTIDMNALCNRIDRSWVSRHVVYYMSDEHVNFVKDKDVNYLEEVDFDLDVNDFLGIVDYLHTFRSVYDDLLVNNIHNDFTDLLSEEVKSVYVARYPHHIHCLMDGLVKLRCVQELDPTFQAKSVDYERLRVVWGMIVGSWLHSYDYIKKLDKESRMNLIPSDARQIFAVLKDNKYVTRELVREKLSGVLHGRRVNNLIGLLVDWELVYDYGGYLYPYWYEKSEKVYTDRDIAQKILEMCDGKIVSVDDVIREFGDDERVERIIESLKTQGDLFEPRRGQIKKV